MRTFSIVKPDAVAAGNTGAILQSLEAAGFRLVALRLVRMTKAEAEGFYGVHRERPFFSSLTDFMSSGPAVVVALERDDAISELRRSDGRHEPGRRGSRHHPGALRHIYRTERDPRFRFAGIGRVRTPLLFPQPLAI